MNRFAIAAAVFLSACASAPAKVEVPAAPPPRVAAPPPPPADPAPVVEGDVTAAQISGLTVIVKRIPGAELAATDLYIRGGARNWTKGNAGIEELALRVATTGGTTALDKEAFGRKLASLGCSLTASTDRDASALAGKGPLASFDALFGLLADSFLRPALPASEVELARNQQLLQLKRRDESPDGRLAALGNSTFLKGSAYENPAEGTAESVASLTAAQLAAHLASLRQTSRLLLVVVGDVDANHVLDLARASFASVPRGAWTQAPIPPPVYAAPALTTETRKLPTNYISGRFAAPGPSDPDYAAARVASSLLAERLFDEVRTKRNLSYAPSAQYEAMVSGSLAGIYVTAVDANTTLKVMIDELRKLRDVPVGDVEMTGSKAMYRTYYLMRAETTDGQAALLASGVILTGDWRFSNRLLAQVDKVTPADVQAYAKKYAGKMQVVLLGDPARLDPALGTSF
jgi:zinc protease